MTADLPALAERLRSATGPSRELDAEIALALETWPDWFFDPRGDRKAVATSPPGYIQAKSRWGLGPSWETPAYTASIDAAVELTRASMAGCEISIHINADGSAEVILREIVWPRRSRGVIAPTAPLAICRCRVEWRIEHGRA